VLNSAVRTDDPRLSDARNPLPNSASYIWNSNSPQAANLNVTGSITGGELFVGDIITTPRFSVSFPIGFNGGPTSGPLPIAGNFVAHGGTVIIIYSGTMWTAFAGLIRMDLILDGVGVGATSIVPNELNSHKTLPTAILNAGRLLAGTHIVSLDPVAGTGDRNDLYQVTAIELPF
jgi:hypothetical protein